MSRTDIDLWVGFFVAIGLAAVLFLGLKVGNMSAASSGETYALQAKFDNIGGLKVRSAIRSAGVVVGRVTSIEFDSTSYVAVVNMQMDAKYKFPRDTFATINTSGLLGDQFVGLEVGGDSEMLKPGETIKKTQSAVVLEKLISQFMFSQASDSKEKQ
jgi:phospholipid/cholesterol/gamma-HCH transport system substrate-binding protein